MASANHIDISSSDSDFEYFDDFDEDWDLAEIKKTLDEDALHPQEYDTSSNSRILPQWATTPGTSSTGNGGGNRASSSNGSSSRPNFNHHSQAQLQTRPSSSNSARITDSFSAIDDHSWHSRGTSGADYVNHSSNQGSRRSLPSSLQPSVSGSRSSNLVENIGSHQYRETHGKPYNTALSNLSYGTNPRIDHFGRGGDASRVLPPSLMHSKSVPNAQHVGSSDPMHRTGVGEERVAEHDERLVYQAALQDLNQPKVEATLPDGLLSVSLLRHQKIALAWMLQKETTSLHCLGGILADDQGLGKTISMIALIQMQRCLQSKSKPEGECSKKAEALNLDDDDDNGTVIIDKPKQAGESVDVKPEKSTSIQEFRTRRPAAGTLVVCPASVLRQWARELDEKVADEAKLDVLIYHGGNRTKDPVELAKYDVVLTTYAIVTNEVPKQPLVDDEDEDQKDGERSRLTSAFNSKKRKKESNGRKKGKKGRKGIDSSAIDSDSGALARVGWFRVILDEAQTIKNHRTQVARACCGLRAKRRWCLSGTPIQNAIDELFSYFRFLRYDPYAAYKSFCNTIKIPISRNSIHGYKKLQAVLRAIMLRRTKGTFIDGEPIINLPPKTIHLAKVDFSPEERAFYSKLEADSRSQFKAYAAAGTLHQNYANILLMLLRLRQACDHPLLVKGFSSDSVGKLSSKMAKRLPRDMLIDLLRLLETNLAICGVCRDPPEDAVVTTCRHVFCYQCVSEYLTGEGSTCPSPHCKEQLAADVVYTKSTLRSCIYDDIDGSLSSSSVEKPRVRQNEYSSSKIKAALDIIKAHCRSKSSGSELHIQGNGSSSSERVLSDEGPIKAIVFSQWTRMLDLIETSLNEALVQYRRLDGTMTLAARDRAVKEFNTDPEVTVMLMSLKAGNLGLNMVAASHVILMDLWWNPTTEDQAIDRAHRIGQTRPVTVSRITIKDTVEDRILALQEEKRKMVASAFGDDPSGGTATRLTVEDLRYLFML